MRADVLRDLGAMRGDFQRFLLAGGTAAVVHWAVLWTGVRLLGWEGTLATSAGFVIASVVSYLLNYFWTFKSAASHRLAVPRFLLVATSGLALNALIFAVAHHGLGLHYLLAQAAATGSVLFWNFALYRQWSFRGEVEGV